MSLFPILIQVEEVAVGKVLRILHAMEGVADIQPIWDEIAKPRGRVSNGKSTGKPVGRPPTKKHKSDDGPRAVDIIVGELLKGQQTGAHLKDALSKHGFAGDGTYALLENLQNRNIVTKVEKGIYRLSDEAQAKLNEHNGPSPPAPLPAPEAKRTGNLRKGEGQRFIANYIRQVGGRAERGNMVQVAGAIGIDARAIENTLYRMRNEKQIRSPEKNIWELTAKGNKDFPPEEANATSNHQEG